MTLVEEAHRDLTYLQMVTGLLQRVRREHPTLGVWEAADYQWWWRKQRPSDDLPQLFWRNSDSSQIVGAATRTDWRGRTALDIIAVPGTNDDVLREFWDRGLALVADAYDVDVFIDTTNEVAQRSLLGAGFTDTQELGTSAWLAPSVDIDVASLPDGYRLVSRAERSSPSHHLDNERNGLHVAERLQQTSLYRPDLDLYVIDAHGEVCASGLFWNDPVTRVGFVEPMATAEEHRRKGLARHIPTEGITRLRAAGSTRIKINYENDNEASTNLYTDTGFEPTMTATGFSRANPAGQP